VDENDKGDGAQYQFQPVPYNRKQFGGLKFKNVVRFLATVQQELTGQGYFEKFEQFNVPGKKEKSQEKKSKKPDTGSMVKSIPLFEHTTETGDACGADKLGLCVIGLMDGSPPNDELRAQSLAILEEVRYTMRPHISLTFIP
jgi:hypothetical protein